MKPGDLVRFIGSLGKTYGAHDRTGIVLEVYPSFFPHKGDDPRHNIQIMFPNFIFKHPNFPITMFEVVSETG